MALEVDRRLAAPDAGTRVRPPDNAMIQQVWLLGGEVAKVVEPYAIDATPAARAYYYLPGREVPFLIRDRRGAFGVAAGRVTTRYSAAGAVLDPPDPGEARALLRHADVVRKLAEQVVVNARRAEARVRAGPDAQTPIAGWVGGQAPRQRPERLQP